MYAIGKNLSFKGSLEDAALQFKLHFDTGTYACNKIIGSEI